MPAPSLLSRRRTLSRTAALGAVQSQLERHSFPRLQMSLIVLLTGAAGWLVSVLLLRGLGVEVMAWRYPLALLVAYGVFLGLLWVWLRTQASDGLDGLMDLGSALTTRRDGCAADNLHAGGGGGFGGAGASGSYADASGVLPSDVLVPLEQLPTSDAGAVGDAVGGVVSLAAEGDEAAVPVVALVIAGVLALGLLLASVYVVWLAPSLLAELLLDGALSYTLYRHLRRDALGQHRHWMQTALRRTVWPFVGVGVFLAGAGVAMQLYAPEAHTLAEVWRHVPAASAAAQ